MFNGLFRRKAKDESRDVAKKRLKFALIYDKLEVSDDILNNLHRDIVEVISRYFEVDKESVTLDINRSGSALVVNTPIKSAKPPEEKTGWKWMK
ncbi:MAG: cell division topological specificity factor MinE [Desulfobacteraceae bacterium]|nr:cell division topological specificity factor MinE [Desulfobacteraceae bacterium]